MTLKPLFLGLYKLCTVIHYTLQTTLLLLMK